MGYEVHVYCDRCGQGYSYPPNYTVGITVARMTARDRGWTIGKQWLCPNCRKKKKIAR